MLTNNPTPVAKIGVVGAGGFLGARLMHVLRLKPTLQGVGIVRSAKSLARLSNAPMEVRVVNTASMAQLAEALSDCEAVVNAINGDVSRIPAETRTVYEAARKAGCKLLIHLSSAVVFGRAKSAGLHDDSVPDVRNWMLYARGKAAGERYLRDVMRDTPMRVVVLRPGLIWGPGSHWVRMAGEQLMHGTVCLSNSGKGIANLVHVDNLVEMILAVNRKPSGPSGFYNVADSETVTWSQYYEGIAKRIGYATTHVRTWPDRRLSFSPQLAIEWCLQREILYRTAKWFLPRMGTNAKTFAKRLLNGEPLPPDYVHTVPKSPPRLTRERWALQNTCSRLPTEKFLRDYGPVQLVTFENALDGAASFLRFAGYGALTLCHRRQF
jgi:nucleoside-diphosphate-sugar epimerase